MIGDKIKQRRAELGWSQEELARKMGYSGKSTICKIEANVNDVNQSTLEKFASVLGVSVEYFFNFNEEQETYKQKRALLEKLSKATEEELDTINKMVDVILNK